MAPARVPPRRGGLRLGVGLGPGLARIGRIAGVVELEVAVGAGAGRNGVALVAQLFECRVAAGGSGRSRFPLGADDVAGGGGSAAGARFSL